MSKPKDYNFKTYTQIGRAMSYYNKTRMEPRFTSVDVLILNLVRSFHESNTKLYMSNKELADIAVVDPSTIQRSIDRLVKVELIQKQMFYSGSKPQRLLIYNESKTNEFLKQI